MFIDCPHCLQNVLPLPDDTCPNCYKNTQNTAGADYTRVKVTIRRDTVMPGVCAQCGGWATGQLRLRREIEIGGLTFLGILAILFRFVLMPTQTLLILAQERKARFRRVRRELTLELPRCGACSGEPTVLDVDFDEDRMTLIVHRTFAERLGASPG